MCAIYWYFCVCVYVYIVCKCIALILAFNMDDTDGRQTHVRVEVSPATDDDDHHHDNEDTTTTSSNTNNDGSRNSRHNIRNINENIIDNQRNNISNVITSIIVDSRGDDKERHCVSLPLYYDQVSIVAYDFIYINSQYRLLSHCPLTYTNGSMNNVFMSNCQSFVLFFCAACVRMSNH